MILASCQGNILLQTAQAIISHPVNKNNARGRVLFNNCSQKSFISDELRKRLSLPTTRTDILTVKIFGEASEVKGAIEMEDND